MTWNIWTFPQVEKATGVRVEVHSIFATKHIVHERIIYIVKKDFRQLAK